MSGQISNRTRFTFKVSVDVLNSGFPLTREGLREIAERSINVSKIVGGSSSLGVYRTEPAGLDFDEAINMGVPDQDEEPDESPETLQKKAEFFKGMGNFLGSVTMEQAEEAGREAGAALKHI